ncbi:MAG: hypothetical protein E7678_03890, partial [Ruminococcaceae bacterium]|nr:hypothetical protein [Oscillospiraceae bacterium]
EGIGSDTYKVYKNPNALSLAYGVSKDINEFNLEDYDSFFNRYNGMLTAMLGSEELIELFKYVGEDSTESYSCEEKKMLRGIQYTTTEAAGTVTINYTAPEAGYYYFYANATGSENIKISYNGHASVSYLAPDSNHIVIGGYHETQEPISITFTIPENDTFMLYTGHNFLWYFTLEEYNELFSQLKENPQFIISSNDSTEDNLVGWISTEEKDQMILTTIPYDKGWKVYVDGEAVETYETLNALMAFDIAEDGYHELTLKYSPNEYKIGIAVSVFGIIVFISICAVDFVFKSLLKKKLKVYEKDYFTLDDIDSEDSPSAPEVLESNATEDEQEEEENDSELQDEFIDNSEDIDDSNSQDNNSEY